MSITLFEYYRFTEQQKLHTVQSQGVFLLSRSEKGSYAHLYSLGNFWVEIFYGEFGEVRKLRAFRGIRNLRPYLDLIDIAEVREVISEGGRGTGR